MTTVKKASVIQENKSNAFVPPYVTYELSKQGKALRSVLLAMAEWTVSHGGKQSKQFQKQLADFPTE